MHVDLNIKYGLRKKEDLENSSKLMNKKIELIIFFHLKTFVQYKDYEKFSHMLMQ
jgi:hypothetical protein